MMRPRYLYSVLDSNENSLILIWKSIVVKNMFITSFIWHGTKFVFSILIVSNFWSIELLLVVVNSCSTICFKLSQLSLLYISIVSTAKLRNLLDAGQLKRSLIEIFVPDCSRNRRKFTIGDIYTHEVVGSQLISSREWRIEYSVWR